MPMRVRALILATAMLLPIPSKARAFCGFYVAEGNTRLYNNATQVVLLRDGTRTVLSMQNNFQGPPEKFAMVVPVPVVLQKEQVKTLDRAIFDKIDQLDAPRLVEYWEQDPCYQPPDEDDELFALGMRKAVVYEMAPIASSAPLVRIEAKFAVGEYDILILSADDSSALERWLKQEKYSIPEGAEPYLRPYVQGGSKFFVAKVDPQRVKFEGGMATLSPLRFHYDADTFALAIRLGLINSNDAQDLIVHVLAKEKRYEVANYPNVTIPTNLDVEESVRGSFGTFYAALFDATLATNPKAVVTEYAWDASSCDPCPGPALEQNDLSVLGADTLQTAPSGAWGWTLTRLHARYTKDALGADLVFREAPAIVGGREFLRSDGKTLEKGAQPSNYNNFQGRYAIRHPWTGPIACSRPHRGVWGGNPAGENAAPTPARDLAFAKRGATNLASLLHTNIEELGIAASGPLNPMGPPAIPGRRYTLFGLPLWAWGAAAMALVLVVYAFARRRRQNKAAPS
jgi:hypothetical protein